MQNPQILLLCTQTVFPEGAEVENPMWTPQAQHLDLKDYPDSLDSLAPLVSAPTPSIHPPEHLPSSKPHCSGGLATVTGSGGPMIQAGPNRASGPDREEWHPP